MVLEDISKAIKVCFGEEDQTFSSIYFSSNEFLKELFDCFSLEDKDVLCVLASSDHAFYAYQNGARSVDTFDINCLTRYYYYLRKWSIIYNKQFYLSRNIFHSYHSLFQLLNKVKSIEKGEEDALFFWKSFLSRVNPRQYEHLFSVDGEQNKIKKLKKLRERLMNEKLTFYNMDLFGEVSCTKKYDVIITSNILEYGWNSMKLNKGRDNLKNLLKDGGKVIGSHYVYDNYSKNFAQEVEIFSQDFEYEEFHKVSKPLHSMKFPLGYSYTKKC